MVKLKKHKKSTKVIWSNYNIDVEDYEKYKKDFDIEEFTGDELMVAALEDNERLLEDIKLELDLKFPMGIVAVANLALKHGRRMGYKMIGSDVRDIFETECEYAEWYIEDGDLKSNLIWKHGVNHVTYREIKDDKDITSLLDSILENERITKRKLSLYTRSIGKDVEKALFKNGKLIVSTD